MRINLKRDTIFFSLAFVFLITGIGFAIPTFGNSYQIDFEIWHESRDVRPSGSGSWDDGNITRQLVIDASKIVRPQVAYQIVPEANLTLWFDGANTMLQINAVDHQYVPGNVNNYTYMIGSATLRDYYSLFLQTVTEPQPTYLYWLIASGIVACLPAIINIFKRTSHSSASRSPLSEESSLDEDLQA